MYIYTYHHKVKTSRKSLRRRRRSSSSRSVDQSLVPESPTDTPPDLLEPDAPSEADVPSETTQPASPVLRKFKAAAKVARTMTRLKSLTTVTDVTKTKMYGDCLKSGKPICNKEDLCNRIHITNAPNHMGDDIEVEFKSESSAASGTIHIVVEAVSNNGQPVEHNPVKEFDSASFTLTASDYIPFLKDATTFKIIATSVETDMSHFDLTMFELSMPPLDVKIVAGSGNNKLVLSTKNPLSIPLTGLKASIGEPFADRVETIGVDMAPNAKWSHEFALESGVGLQDVVSVSLNCKEIFSTRGWIQDSSESNGAVDSSDDESSSE